MFSSTVRSWYKPKRCAMYPIWSSPAPAPRPPVWPATRALPSLGSISPHSMRSVVVLPAPSGPTSPKISPLATVRSRWSTAVSVPKRLVRPLVSMMVSMILSMVASIPPQQYFRIRRHVGLQLAARILHLDLYPVHQLHPLLLRLDLLRRELRLRGDKRYMPCIEFARIRIGGHPH